MHYNDLAQAGAIGYLGDAEPFGWLSLSSLRFLYGGRPDAELAGGCSSS